MRITNRLVGRRVTAAVAALVTGLALAACGAGTGAAGGTGENDPDATLRVMYGMAASLDPAQAPEPTQLTFSTWPMYDTLVRVSTDNTYEPMLATGWTFSADGRTLELELRDDVTFSDGEKFDAAAVVANLEYYKSADKSTVQTALAAVESVEAVGEYEVAIHLLKPTTTILTSLSSSLGGIMISPKAIAAGDIATKPVGTGAYTLESFKPGESAVYVRRTDEGGIWDEGTGKVARVELARIASADAKLNALKSGQIDLTSWAGDPNDYAGTPIRTVPMEGVLNMVGLYFNPKFKPLDDVRVRKAINLAIDRKAVVDAFVPSDSPRGATWPEGMPGFDEEREGTYPYDPEAAKKLLAEAGYENGVEIPGEFLISPAASIDKAAEAVQAQLAEVGIDIKLRTVDILAQVTTYAGGKNSGQFMFLSLPSIDPYAWLRRLFVDPLWNPGGADPKVAASIEGIDDPALSDEDRTAKISAALDLATENPMFAPLWQGVGGLAASPKVQGLDDLASFNGGVANLRYVSMTK
ncbi:hypothetical protein FHP29_00130 [Nocardioides albidus]|uniref:Solute-binding protein family 5 domain-containing protein n=1 Tax=Nocardioides albidus TaxID=1517589 RepID=A0A5C4WU07_9ACTN|nr:ABC transporter substrate-binding protein [Nocardioides albidus]TNM50849.1 hypothetical protein FHP29_00130 [Nocardioides albidus]